MSAWITKFLTEIVIGILSAISGWVIRHVQEWLKDKKQAAEDEKKTSDATKQLEEAKTREELENAAKTIAGNFGSNS